MQRTKGKSQVAAGEVLAGQKKKHLTVRELRCWNRCPGHKTMAKFAEVIGSLLRAINNDIFCFFLHMYEVYSLFQIQFSSHYIIFLISIEEYEYLYPEQLIQVFSLLPNL